MPDLAKVPDLSRPPRKFKSKINKYLGKPKLHDPPGTQTRVYYVLAPNARVDFGTLPEKEAFLQPGYTPRDSPLQLLAPVSKEQIVSLRKEMSESGPIPGAEFNRKLDALSSVWGTEPFCINRMTLSKSHGNDIVSVIASVDDISGVPTTRVRDGLFLEEKPSNVFDYEVPGIVVFRCYIWMFLKVLTPVLCKFFDMIFHTKGLVRKLCAHLGKFHMIGPQQTGMASGSLVRPATSYFENDYWSKDKLLTSALPFVQSAVNFLGEQAVQHQSACGCFLIHLHRWAISTVGVMLTIAMMCCFNIYTYFGFCNTPHTDCDHMYKEFSTKVRKRLLDSPHPELRRWLEQFNLLFGEKTLMPLPTTCCWSLVEECTQWVHIQYFVLVDLRMGFDVSSDVMVGVGDGQLLGQLGATFYGPLVRHNTSAPLWLSEDGTDVTVVCPGDGCFNVAWGRSGGESEETKRRRRRERMGLRAV